MAEVPGPDALICLRQSIASNSSPITTTTSEPASKAETNLSLATHLQFNHAGHQVFSLTTPTRFESSGTPVDLRSIYFAWLMKDVAIPEYIASTQDLNQKLSEEGATGGSVQNLVFAEKLDLITWLESASDESEYIKPLPHDEAAAQAAGAADVAAGTVGGLATIPSAATVVGKTIDPRLREIYNGERKMGDRNSILRGIKPTDFSYIHKYTESFLGRNRSKPGKPLASVTAVSNPTLIQNRPKQRRPEPIILLSPSASSLLRMSNIKSFLESGVYAPPDSASENANMLTMSRLLPSVDPQRPLRFILVDTPEQFKPDYWSRVVAVFTTGQTWQFKSYKWQSPADLFSHALGIYVGWRGETIPATVLGWGRGVITTAIDKYHGQPGAQGRWRDREVVEYIWSAIEEAMRNRGWNKEGFLR